MGSSSNLSLSIYGINGKITINNNSSYKTGYSATSNTDQSTYVGTCETSWGTVMCGSNEDITQPYNTATGYNASTTGNISGVYDMSGGAYEYMAAYMAGYGVTSDLGTSSGFSANPATTYGTQYFDVYSREGTYYTYSNRILGDATGELGPFRNYKDRADGSRPHSSWYADGAYFVYSILPRFIRGGLYNDSVLASQLYFAHRSGEASLQIGYRIVLAI